MSNTQPQIDKSIASTTITTIEQIIKAPYEEIEYGRAVLVARKNSGERVLHSGRIVGRKHPFLTLRRKSHTVDVNLNEMDWKLNDWIPIRSPIEKQQIKQQYKDC